MSYTGAWPYQPPGGGSRGRGRAKNAKVALERRVELLQKVDLFAGLSKQHLRAIGRVASVRTFNEGTRIVVEGHKGAGCFLIVEGSSEVFKGDKQVAKLGPGEVVGEISIFDNVPRSATVIAADEVVALQVSREGMLSVIEENPRVAVRLLELMAHRLRLATEASGTFT
ncbi:MAG TPA: cyclic nucleotide-binding domain-containing protein [Acidimicrobiia bacterium]|nr:cyclic nucleotide-binding domain-containing protein [Acidimicrobiia bacterium]